MIYSLRFTIFTYQKFPWIFRGFFVFFSEFPDPKPLDPFLAGIRAAHGEVLRRRQTVGVSLGATGSPKKLGEHGMIFNELQRMIIIFP